MADRFDVAIVGAGMAGASLAAEIGPEYRIVMLEAEERPGYHATGRSAAFWEECYGGPDIVPLTSASGPWLQERGFLAKRGALYLAREEDEPQIENFFRTFAGSGADPRRIGRGQVERLVPGIRPAWDRAIHQPRCADIDVAGVHGHYLSASRSDGVEMRCRARLTSAQRSNDEWQLQLGNGETVRAGVLVNAAGAWADHIARMAGAKAIGIQPFRRTVVQLRTDPAPPADMPLCLDISGSFYFRPENGRLWLSPHDEIPSDPCDAAPEEIDIATAIDRLQKALDWRIQAVEHKWAGLRSFTPDRRPVYGFDPQVPGFFWFAGQGGYGIQTAPAAARLGAQLLTGKQRDAMTANLNVKLYAPDRFAPVKA
ncbi:NAD(P)/FAD-dependent oxidoreductase [Aurantiacibacter marinus]|uniref:FAD-dependent oxidoreductase n=1 Tax=Aurantiacibacter marinus TaxID=874156 RepID=A0A0H0XQM4_9SPHN|nr:FAD-dependent oxidoreductase [Aurantiacibacter marinus]KLI64252.1 FAD-dependent oxidoreductase [Aurantiacibacter marinus]